MRRFCLFVTLWIFVFGIWQVESRSMQLSVALQQSAMQTSSWQTQDKGPECRLETVAQGHALVAGFLNQSTHNTGLLRRTQNFLLLRLILSCIILLGCCIVSRRRYPPTVERRIFKYIIRARDAGDGRKRSSFWWNENVCLFCYKTAGRTSKSERSSHDYKLYRNCSLHRVCRTFVLVLSHGKRRLI